MIVTMSMGRGKFPEGGDEDRALMLRTGMKFHNEGVLTI